jgi:hypothetical protein
MSENKRTRKNLKNLSSSQKAERYRQQQKECCKRYYLKNKEKLDNNNKKHYQEHREERLQYQTVYQKKRTAEQRIPKLEQQLAELKSLSVNAF